MSISFMIQTTSVGQLGILSTGGPGNYFELLYSCSGNLYFCTRGSESDYDSACVGKVLSDGLWHTVLIAYDGITLTLYEDGLFQFSTTTTINTIGNSYNILGKAAVDWGSFVGSLKNVMFYDYAVTISYVLANSYQTAGGILYNSGN